MQNNFLIPKAGSPVAQAGLEHAVPPRCELLILLLPPP